MATAQTRRQEYETEKAALDAVNAPPSAYRRLDEAFFAAKAAPSGLIAWVREHSLYVLPTLATIGTMLVFFLIEGPRNIVHGVTGWALGLAELHTAENNATITASTATVAPRRTEAETRSLEAQAHWAELQAQANAEKAMAERDAAEANARMTKMQACKVQAEAVAASGINRYDVPSFLDPECRTLLKLKSLTER